MQQYDVSASQMLTATGNVKDVAGNNLPRSRIKGAYYVASVAGTIELRDGGAGGTLRAVFPVGVAAANIIIPGEGLLFTTDVHATVVGATLTGITFLYG